MRLFVAAPVPNSQFSDVLSMATMMLTMTAIAITASPTTAFMTSSPSFASNNVVIGNNNNRQHSRFVALQSTLVNETVVTSTTEPSYEDRLTSTNLPFLSTIIPGASSSGDSGAVVEEMDVMKALQGSLQKREQQVGTALLPNSADLPEWFEPVAWRGVIVILCALWASNFAAAKLVMAEPGVDSSLYALARFGVAASALAIPKAISSITANDTTEVSSKDDSGSAIDWETIRSAVACGSWVAFGYLGQTVGLLTTTASKSCVICSMHCVFVAVLAEYWRVAKASDATAAALGSSSASAVTSTPENATFDLKRLLPAALAVIGVAIVELKGAGGAPTIGDALSFAQPIGFGMGYLTLEEIMAKKPEAASLVTTIKLLVVATASFGLFELSPLMSSIGIDGGGGLLSALSGLSFRIPDFTPILQSPLALGGILYTGLITTAFALWIESIAFAKVPATDASIILTTEPLIAAGFGAVALGETFGVSDYVGATLIIGACALAVLLEDGGHGAADADTELA